MSVRVLVVEDEWQVRGLLEEFLKEQDFQVFLAEDGEEAIARALEVNPDVILLDIKLPGIDGIEVCKRLRAHESTALIPVIMLTAYEDKDVEAYLEGADDFIKKPFNPVELAVRIKSVLRIRHLTDELERTAAYAKELEKRLS